MASPRSTLNRSPERLRHHYEVERELAARLRSATQSERRTLYTQVYDELFRRVPDHPQLARKGREETRARAASAMRMIGPLLRPDATFLEIGAGDCSVSFAVASRVRKVFAVDVSEEVSHNDAAPSNFALILSDGTSIPVPPGSVDLAYSNQLMEHLHPDDARAQLGNIACALAPGGAYLCVTPHRFNGPHDISGVFEDVANGFHLKEYTYGELGRLLRRAGFRKVEALVGVRGRFWRAPLAPFLALERLMARLPHPIRRRLGSHLPLRIALGFQLHGT
jgi:SAM-dependent methyltransferase